MPKAFLLINHMSHQKAWGDAFGLGLKRHGWTVDGGTEFQRSDLLVTWGVRKTMAMHDQKTAGGEICILERGYIGDRHHWTSVSFGGGLNGRAEFRGPFEDETRFRRYHAPLLQPWRPMPAGGDRVALLVGQVEGDASLARVNINNWYRDATAALEAMGFNVEFRPHPLAQGKRKPARSLAADLARADVAVTFNSNTGVEAVLAGVPTYALDRGSMAWDVTAHDLTITPFCPPRADWAKALAWKQYSVEEMASGMCWGAVSGKVYA